MSKKFIPNGDLDFATMAEIFAGQVTKDPGRYAVSEEDARRLGEAVAKFRAALRAARPGGPGNRASVSPLLTQAKELARGEAEAIIRRLANVARATKSLDPMAKFELGLRERPRHVRPTACPDEAPRLRFLRALHEGGCTPRHELSFTDREMRKSRPEGAVRLELFVDLVPPEEEIPQSPWACAAAGGRPWYLRSYTKSPIVVEPPMARVPMRVVYWGRWAGAQGDVGPFSATAAGWIEGGSAMHLPGGVGYALGGRKAVELIDGVRTAAQPEGEARGRTYVVAVMEAQLRSMAPRQLVALPGAGAGAGEEREMLQIEGATAEASAASEAA